MPDFISAIETIDKFIGITKELAKLPALVLPQYMAAPHKPDRPRRSIPGFSGCLVPLALVRFRWRNY